ncbi:Steroid receptor RNA activator-protein/coat protein complex II, Sec31 [Artemisia annua]|uniref:Steroid receptor RNA activator-protein/coat protein complex II, Sec31 n=1 Tax=Artemisia annua TaxID=35608 RepID=A0A2U1PWP2_ARTAN|nr:Steroid receptor RNA activator-protein/coat protein complex II, Sec31 [Artemisia annua]
MRERTANSKSTTSKNKVKKTFGSEGRAVERGYRESIESRVSLLRLSFNDYSLSVRDEVKAVKVSYAIMKEERDLMEKTVILALATGQKRFSASLCKLFKKYAEILASQGLLTSAMEYLKLMGTEDLSPELVILRYRIAFSSEPVFESIEIDVNLVNIFCRDKSAYGDLMEKTVVLALATGHKRFSASLCKLFKKYAEILASQGLLTSAMEYLKLMGTEDLSPELVILRYRIAFSSEPGEEDLQRCRQWHSDKRRQIPCNLHSISVMPDRSTHSLPERHGIQFHSRN